MQVSGVPGEGLIDPHHQPRLSWQYTPAAWVKITGVHTYVVSVGLDNPRLMQSQLKLYYSCFLFHKLYKWDLLCFSWLYITSIVNNFQKGTQTGELSDHQGPSHKAARMKSYTITFKLKVVQVAKATNNTDAARCYGGTGGTPDSCLLWIRNEA